ncbi:hypothetical protein [Schumannella soli]|uniref:Uncharacterized protein n=1 Tax=Schumannella soli TaxID=2590779 RepID=A0A506XTP2_9MICO|nr:hypothetical protein [Schumannella soli]TPW76071.1 hypothetical protein FJ657_09635 [Schumannella soli]
MITSDSLRQAPRELRPLHVPRPSTGQLRLRPSLRGNGFVVGSVEANGPDTVGFANRDRVAWRDDSTELPDLLLKSQDDVLGVPSWITDQQVVDYLGPGLVARALMRSSHPVGRGDDVRVISTDALVSSMATAWARHLGAHIVEQGPALVLEHSARGRVFPQAHGRLAQAAVDVFQAIRAGMFDDIDADQSRAVTAA